MKEFVHKEAKAGKPVICRNKTPARILAFDIVGGFPMLSAILQTPSEEILQLYSIDGKPSDSSKSPDFDLCMNTTSKKLFMFLCDSGPNIRPSIGAICDTQQEAKDMAAVSTRPVVSDIVEIDYEIYT